MRRRLIAAFCAGTLLVGGFASAAAATASFPGPQYPVAFPDCRPFDTSSPPQQENRGLTPRQWQQAVGLPLDPGGTPAPQRIVLLERSQLADLDGVAQLLSVCGLPAVTITEVGDTGGEKDAGEATLDAAVAAAGMPPNSELWMANSTSGGFEDAIQKSAEACGIDTTATPPTKRTVAAGPEQPAWPTGGCIISASYTDNEGDFFPGPDADTAAAIALLDDLEALGVIVVFSAGDESSGGCSTNEHKDPNDIGLTTRFPASHPGVLSVGGLQWDDQATSMVDARDVPYLPGESYDLNVWKDNSDSSKCQNFKQGPGGISGGSGGGGGQSIHFAMPDYQVEAAAANYPGNTGMRMVPDVSALATWPMYALIRNGQWELTGGTSAAAPSVAVGLANVNAALSARGLPVIDNSGGPMDIHTIVYGSAFASVLSDVTLGDNDLFGFDGSTVVPGYSPSMPAWQALPGYDMASGMGQINFSSVLGLLIAQLDPPVVPPQYAVGFDANAGTCLPATTGPVTAGSWAQLPRVDQCSRAGSVLAGWSFTPDGAPAFRPGASIQVIAPNTLYAVWAATGSTPAASQPSGTTVAPSRPTIRIVVCERRRDEQIRRFERPRCPDGWRLIRRIERPAR